MIGLVEGLTEYLPVSSTGHIVLAQRWMGIEDGTAANAYAIAVQAGAIAAVLGLYKARVGQMLRGLRGVLRLGEGDEAGQRLGWAVAKQPTRPPEKPPATTRIWPDPARTPTFLRSPSASTT